MAINNKFDASIEIETGFYSNLSRMNMTMDEALKEFIDNSTTSFYDHLSDLKAANRCDQCIVKIDWDDVQMTISDNAYGMNKDDFKRALRLSARAGHYSETSRGHFGIGLKYAAANIGRCYEIESYELGNGKKYDSIINLDELENTNQKTVSVTESNVASSDHGTIITITNLLVPFSYYNSLVTKKETNFEKLLYKLSKIYYADIRKGTLKLLINNTEVVVTEPALKKDKETGSQYRENIDRCSFRFNGKTYEYTGWIGILKTANVENAGFSLNQQNRSIELNYRPKSLFGVGNDYRYQRVVGEIELIGDNWKVSFTKNRFQWANGLEDAFIKSLKNNNGVSEIFKIAKDLRTKKENVTVTQLKRSSIEKTFEKKPDTIPSSKSNSKAKAGVQKVDTSKANEIPDQTSTDDDSLTIKTQRNNIDYIFKIVPSQDKIMKNKWFHLKTLEPSINKYEIDINTRVKMFEDYCKKDMKELIVKLAISLAIAQLDSVNNGLKMSDSQILINSLNEIVSTM